MGVVLIYNLQIIGRIEKLKYSVDKNSVAHNEVMFILLSENKIVKHLLHIGNSK